MGDVRIPLPPRPGPPATRAPPPTEEAIHRAVVDLLARAARPGVAWTHMPSGEARGAGIGGKLKGMGVQAGWPDLLIVIGGRLHGLELKRGGDGARRGRLSEAQRDAHEKLRAAGAAVVIAYGLDDAVAALETWGAVRVR